LFRGGIHFPVSGHDGLTAAGGCCLKNGRRRNISKRLEDRSKGIRKRRSRQQRQQQSGGAGRECHHGSRIPL
jgi:hypothetical protein